MLFLQMEYEAALFQAAKRFINFALCNDVVAKTNFVNLALPQSRDLP